MQQQIPALFSKNASTTETYEKLLKVLDRIGSYGIEEKKTCVHAVTGKGAFLGIHPRKEGLRLTLPMSRALEGPRIAKTEQASANRFHNDLNVRSASEVDEELIGWITEAYARM